LTTPIRPYREKRTARSNESWTPSGEDEFFFGQGDWFLIVVREGFSFPGLLGSSEEHTRDALRSDRLSV
jgi:hypothetical protein